MRSSVVHPTKRGLSRSARSGCSKIIQVSTGISFHSTSLYGTVSNGTGFPGTGFYSTDFYGTSRCSIGFHGTAYYGTGFYSTDFYGGGSDS